MHPAEKLMRDMEAEINSLRATRSRQAELLGRAAKALEPFALVAEHDIGDTETDRDRFTPITHNRAPLLTVGNIRTAASTLDAIREELGK